MKNINTKSSSATDWERIDSLTDEQIDTSDIPPLDADFFSRAKLQMPSKPTVVLNVDADGFRMVSSSRQKFKREDERSSAYLRGGTQTGSIMS